MAASYEADFLLAGGRFEHVDSTIRSDLSKLKEKVIINCTGYGARALWRDESSSLFAARSSG